jgi:hypothetical protein
MYVKWTEEYNSRLFLFVKFCHDDLTVESFLRSVIVIYVRFKRCLKILNALYAGIKRYFCESALPDPGNFFR